LITTVTVSSEGDEDGGADKRRKKLNAEITKEGAPFEAQGKQRATEKRGDTRLGPRLKPFVTDVSVFRGA
jgi:hypothetical protein